MEKKVSVVLPVYNGEKYLSQSIDSILAQTYGNWELIIIDDGSTDNTPNIAKAYAERDERITYSKNPANMKLPKSLNRGFSLTTGDYLTWTSDDNIYYPDAFEVMARTLESDPQIGFVFSSCDVIDGDGKKVSEWVMTRVMETRKIVGANIVGACFMYTRKVYEQTGEYNPDLFLTEDFDYWQRIFARFQVQPIEKKLYAYRDHAASLTNTSRQEEICRICEITLLNNAKLYDTLDTVQKFYLYEGLHRNRSKSAVEPDHYKKKYEFYKQLHLLTYRLPRKLGRMLKSST